ncbi:MAG: hypothetical protein ACJAQ3_003906, partial [Planctomycetota bacterium]
ESVMVADFLSRHVELGALGLGRLGVRVARSRNSLRK